MRMCSCSITCRQREWEEERQVGREGVREGGRKEGRKREWCERKEGVVWIEVGDLREAA